MSSYFDRRRDPAPLPDVTSVGVREPGSSGAPATQYRRPTSGHKIPGYRHRVQTVINSMSGEALDARTAAMLDEAVEGLSDRDHHEVLRAKAIGTAVGAHARASELAGHLGGGQWLADPADTVKRVFGIGVNR